MFYDSGDRWADAVEAFLDLCGRLAAVRNDSTSGLSPVLKRHFCMFLDPLPSRLTFMHGR